MAPVDIRTVVTEPAELAEECAQIRHFCAELARDLQLLADLHALELQPESLKHLQCIGFPELLALQPDTPNARLASQSLQAFLQQKTTVGVMDQLASDFAAIYLNGSLHAHPSESVWLDEEELTCQQPMFQVRGWYARHHLQVPDWRKLADDHLVNELLFTAHLLAQAARQDQPQPLLAEAAQFMDEHLLRWFQSFCERVAQRCSTAFYASLAMLSSQYAEYLRDWLADILDTPRPSAEEVEARCKAAALRAMPPQTLQYFPGMAPSW